jgi:hypothetical protein
LSSIAISLPNDITQLVEQRSRQRVPKPRIVTISVQPSGRHPLTARSETFPH